MRGGAEPKQANAIPILHVRNAQTSKANNARAQKRSSLPIIEASRKWKDKICPSQRILRVPAGNAVACEGWGVAQILEPSAAVGTLAVDPADPGDAHSRAMWQIDGFTPYDSAHDLMSRNDIGASNW
jgi:hypothetical protein